MERWISSGVYTEGMMVPQFAVTTAPLDLSALIRLVSTPGPVGAVATFLGLAREEARGRRVLRLEYDAYEPLAVRTLQRIGDEITARWPQVRFAVHHRLGTIEIGGASVAIAAAAPHRAEAFAACRYAIERIKQIAPIWKHEFFEGGDGWVEGATADPEDERARQDAYRRACA